MQWTDAVPVTRLLCLAWAATVPCLWCATQDCKALRHGSYGFDGRRLRGCASVRGEDGDRRRTAEKGVRGSWIHANTDEHFSK
jgi:hypothetical protein